MAGPKDGLGYRVQIVGLERWQKDLTTTRASIPHFVADANKKVGEIVKQETINRMNRQFKLSRADRTGALERSIFTAKDPVMTPTSQGVFVGIGKVGEGIPYAGWWEYGYEGEEHPPPYRLRAPEGRTLYPGIRRRMPEIRAIYEVVARRLGNRMMRGGGV